MNKPWYNKRRSTPILEEMEPRLLFSADVAEALTTEVMEQDCTEEPPSILSMESEPQTADITIDQPVEENNDASTGPIPSQETQEPQETEEPVDQEEAAQETEPPAADTTSAQEPAEDTSDNTGSTLETELSETASSNELVVINSNVHDYEQLISDLEHMDDPTRSIEIVLLDNAEDGLAQMSEILDDRGNLDAIHIISHGSEGQLALGNSWLDTAALTTHSSEISSWNSALNEEADILLYGCGIADGEDGQLFIDSLAQLTNTEVTASDDLTATTARGGDWDLEYRSGTVETSSFGADTLQTWDGQLAVVTVTSFNDFSDGGDTSSIASLLATPGSDGISLREAIIATNNDEGADEIKLAAGTYSLNLSGPWEDLANSDDLDILDDLTITGVGLAETIIEGTMGVDRIFDIHGSSAVTISGVTIQGGDTLGLADGGAIRIDSSASVTITNSLLTDNHARFGGAILNAGTLTLIDSTINDNISYQGGGGISTSGTTILERVTISNNETTGDQGGGIEVSNGSFTATNVTISDNSSEEDGGGIFTLQPITLVNTTITNNSSTFGSGIMAQTGGSVDLTNTLIAGNSSEDIRGTFISSGHNLIGNGDSATGLTDGLNNDQVGTSATSLDPRLGPLQDNGGPTWTHALLAGSSAIDAGTDSGAPDVDQRGNNRPVDGDHDLTATVDIGAFEYSPTPHGPLWLTTVNDENNGGQPGIDTWLEGDLLEITDPNLSFGSTTDGTVGIAFRTETFAPGQNLNAIHYVSVDIQLGASGFQLEAGDLLLVSDAKEWTGNSSAPPAGFTNDLSSVEGLNDVIVFRPDTPNDYSTGSFALLLDNPADTEIRGITLIEQNTRVGDADLQAGDFLFTRKGGEEDDDIWLFQTDDVGLSITSGTASILLEGDEIGIQKLNGIDLVESTTTIGGETVNSGTILLNSDENNAAGLEISKYDIYALHVTATTLVGGSGNGAATATMFFDGGDMNFNEGSEELNGFTLTTINNQAPVLTLPGSPLTYTVNDPATQIDPSAILTDSDSDNLDGGTLTVSISTGGTTNDNLSILPGGLVALSVDDILVSGTTIGTIDALNNGSGGTDLVITWNLNSAPESVEAVLQQIAYSNSSATPDLSTRIIDFMLDDGDGGSTIAQQSVNFVAGNEAPVITLPSSAATFTENGMPAIIDGAATITDDGATLNGGTMTISIITNGSNDDILSILSGGSIGLNGFDIEYDNGSTVEVIGTFSGGSGGMDLTIAWNANSTSAAAQEVLQQIAFSNTSEDPTGLTRELLFSLTDGAGGTSLAVTQQVNVNPVNDAPSGTDTTVVTNEDTLYTFSTTDFGFSDALDNDAFNAIKITSLPLLGTLTCNAMAVATGDYISAEDINLGLLQYSPPLNGAGSAYAAFDFQVQDTGGTANGGVDLSAVCTMTIEVTPVNDAPVAADDSATGSEDTSITGNVLANDSDTEGSSLTATLVAGPANGTLTLNPDGTFTYTPDSDWSGTDSFTYRANDGNLDSNSATVIITVNPVNDAPLAADDSAMGNEDTPISGNVLANDSDTEGSTLTATLVAGPANGTLTLNPDGTFTYSANSDWSGTDSFTYRANDGNLDSNSATVTITVNPVNDAPLAADDSAIGSEDTPISGNVLANDSDTEGSSLTATLVAGPANGTLTLNPDGTFTYSANSDWSGTDSFTYRANDGSLDSNSATVTITVNPVNDAPLAADDSAIGSEDTPITGNVLANDSDTEGSALTATLVAGPANGTLTLNPDGTFTYSANSDWSGTDSFTYRANDGSLDSNSATVIITVNPVIDTPYIPLTETIDPEETQGDSPEENTPPTDESAEQEQPIVIDEQITPADNESQPLTPDKAPVESVKTPTPPKEAAFAESTGKEMDFIPSNKTTATTPAQLETTVTQRESPPPQHSTTPKCEIGQVSPTSILLKQYLDQMQFDSEVEYNKAFEQLRNSLEDFREETENDIQYYKTVIGSAIAVSTGLSVGYVIWLIRGGMLLSSVLFSMPAWQIADPLPLLAHGRDKEEEKNGKEDEETLETIIVDGSRNGQEKRNKVTEAQTTKAAE